MLLGNRLNVGRDVLRSLLQTHIQDDFVRHRCQWSDTSPVKKYGRGNRHWECFVSAVPRDYDCLWRTIKDLTINFHQRSIEWIRKWDRSCRESARSCIAPQKATNTTQHLPSTDVLGVVSLHSNQGVGLSSTGIDVSIGQRTYMFIAIILEAASNRWPLKPYVHKVKPQFLPHDDAQTVQCQPSARGTPYLPNLIKSFDAWYHPILCLRLPSNCLSLAYSFLQPSLAFVS